MGRIIAERSTEFAVFFFTNVSSGGVTYYDFSFYTDLSNTSTLVNVGGFSGICRKQGDCI